MSQDSHYQAMLKTALSGNYYCPINTLKKKLEKVFAASQMQVLVLLNQSR
jgi:hypothetical protein